MAECKECGKSKNMMNEHKFKKSGDQLYCLECYEKTVAVEEAKAAESRKNIILTTTPSVDGHRAVQYLGIESVEVVIMASEFVNAVSELIGGTNKPTHFEQALQKAKDTAFNRIRDKAAANGANAVLGVDVDYQEMSHNRMGVIVSGTLVKIQPN